MQASKNFSDLWLAFWSESRNSPNGTVTMDATPFNVSTYGEHLKQNVICIFNDLLFSQNNTCISSNHIDADSISVDSFYLVIYAGAAIVNSLLSLIRALSFAYAGLKAAKFIHNRLLKSVFNVCVPLADHSFSFELVSS